MSGVRFKRRPKPLRLYRLRHGFKQRYDVRRWWMLPFLLPRTPAEWRELPRAAREYYRPTLAFFPLPQDPAARLP